jgi:hypothetical protein
MYYKYFSTLNNASASAVELISITVQQEMSRFKVAANSQEFILCDM